MDIPVIGGKADGHRIPSGRAPQKLTLPCLLYPIPPWDPKARPDYPVQIHQEHYHLAYIAVGQGEHYQTFRYYRLEGMGVEQAIDRLLEGYLRPKESE